MFSETRAQAANPLKASQAYKNIADGLTEAKESALDANIIVDGVNRKVFFYLLYFNELLLISNI